MTQNTAKQAKYNDADSLPKPNGKARLLTLDALDQRTKAAKLAKGLVDGMESDLGGADNLTVTQRQLVQRTAVLGAIAEGYEVAWLSGDDVDVAEYIVALNAQRRCCQVLGLKREAKPVQSLESYLQSKQAATA